MNRVNFEREGDCAFSERMFRSSQVISMIIYRYANTNTTNGLLCCQQFAFSHHRFVFIFDLILFLFLSLEASIFCCFFFLPYRFSRIQKDEILHAHKMYWRLLKKEATKRQALHEKGHLSNGKKQLKYFQKILSQRQKLRRYQIDSHLFGTLAHFSIDTVWCFFSLQLSFTRFFFSCSSFWFGFCALVWVKIV